MSNSDGEYRPTQPQPVRADRVGRSRLKIAPRKRPLPLDFTPEPALGMIKAPRLDSLASAEIRLPQPVTAAPTTIRVLLFDLIHQTKLRELAVFLKSTGQQVYFVDKKTSERSADFSLQDVQTPHHQALSVIILQLLEHFPTPVNVISKKTVMWLQEVAVGLLQAQHTSVRRIIQEPYLCPIKDGYPVEYFHVELAGYDPQDAAPWVSHTTVSVDRVRLDADITLPDDITWTPRQKKAKGRPTTKEIREDFVSENSAAVAQARKLAKLITVRLHGFIGTKFRCKELITSFKRAFDVESKSFRHGNTTLQVGPHENYP